ncbi:lytic transglycosylase [Streptomyces halobius]|uniref:Lytic transglycosylase n=1 Tax=Streptomyces halobius TaxID=2879846 RepID=A0ABY4MEA7_9ACTN|nr:lytic transglycosylase [Streptomyces halobius]UQA96068.1 lytic transglycosylase [Streptomyces halobius]
MAATFRRRFLRGAASTVVVALAWAALTASQAPGATGRERDPAPPPADTSIDGGSTYYTDLPPLNSPVPPRSPDHPDGDGSDNRDDSDSSGTGPAEAGIPATVLAAYKKAASRLAGAAPGCRLSWQLLASIGKVESGQAHGGAVDSGGTTFRPILGPQLNGHGFARIADTDGGRYDGDRTHDRAVGPMQFIPSTWSNGGPDGGGWGADGNGDGEKDPNNIFDAALGAGRYLCSGGRDLTAQRDLNRAILGYNNSTDYLRTVLSWYAFYREGTYEVPDGKGVLPVRRAGSGSEGGRSGHGDGKGDGPGAHHAQAADKPRKPGEGGKPGKGGTPGKGNVPGNAGKSAAPGRPSKPGAPGTAAKPGEPDAGTTPQPTPTLPTPPTTPTPAPTPTPKPPTSPTTPTNPAPLTVLERVGDKDLTATAGAEFATSPQVRAVDAAGKPVAGIPVRFLLTGTTDARFPGDATAVTVTSGEDGLATAPTMRAGDRPGSFTVRAQAEGRPLPAVAFGMTVQAGPAPKADTLTRTSDEELTATAGGAFPDDAVDIKATYRGKAAAGVAVTATMVADDQEQPVENDKGPYVKDPEATGADRHEPLRALTTLTTDDNGLLTLPKIHTDTHTGTFLLRLTTADGAVLTVELNVAPPADG